MVLFVGRVRWRDASRTVELARGGLLVGVAQGGALEDVDGALQYLVYVPLELLGDLGGVELLLQTAPRDDGDERENRAAVCVGNGFLASDGCTSRAAVAVGEDAGW